MSQKQEVLKYMRRYGGITTLQAFKSLGITRLSARIYDLREDGYNIVSEDKKVKTRTGEKTTVNTADK